MNRIDRLTAIIIFLQGRQRVTVNELSERYSITPRTVYRDLRALQEAGVPIGSEPGEGYYIVKGYHLPPVHFSREEASSLLAGERYLKQMKTAEPGRSYRSALDKIRSVLPSDDQEYLESVDRHLKVFRYNRVEGEEIPDEKIFYYLQDAIVNRKLIRIDYFSSYNEEKTSRDVEPLGLLLMDKYWYLAAWCRMRNDYRMFRLDRFDNYSRTGEVLDKDSEHTLKEFYERNLHDEGELEEVVVRFQRDMVRYIGDQKYIHGWAWEQKTEMGVEMTFLCSHPEYLSRWLLLWGDAVTVLKSDRVKKRVQELAVEVYKHHTDS